MLAEARDTTLRVLDDFARPADDRGSRSRTHPPVEELEILLKNSERLGLVLSEYVGLGDWRLAFLISRQSREGHAGEVSAVITKYLKSGNRMLGPFVPEDESDRADITDVPDVTALVKDYEGKPPFRKARISRDPGDIEKRTTRGNSTTG